MPYGDEEAVKNQAAASAASEQVSVETGADTGVSKGVNAEDILAMLGGRAAPQAVQQKQVEAAAEEAKVEEKPVTQDIASILEEERKRARDDEASRWREFMKSQDEFRQRQAYAAPQAPQEEATPDQQLAAAYQDLARRQEEFDKELNKQKWSRWWDHQLSSVDNAIRSDKVLGGNPDLAFVAKNLAISELRDNPDANISGVISGVSSRLSSAMQK